MKLIISEGKKMTKFVTINAGNNTYDRLVKISKNISLSETISLLIFTSKEKKIIKLLEEFKQNRHHKEYTGKGTKIFKIFVDVRKQLNGLRQKHSISIILDVLLQTYDKKDFNEMKHIKQLGRA